MRLDRIFDHFTINFGAGLFRQPQARRWMEAADVLDRKDPLSEYQAQIVKAVGVLGALGDFCPLRPIQPIISAALADQSKPSTPLRDGLRTLRERSILTYRTFNETYRIWEGSDIDIDDRIAEGHRKLRGTFSLADGIRRHLEPKPMVARRHSFEGGALRFFETVYVDAAAQLDRLALVSPGAAGQIVVCLAPGQEQMQAFRDAAVIKTSDRMDLIVAVPQQMGELLAAVAELAAMRWAWDVENTPELRDDRVARRELALRMSEAEHFLHRNLGILLDPRKEPVGSDCAWFWHGKQQKVRTRLHVSQLLSKVSEKVFHAAPCIRNELIVRRSLSSAAAAARRTLVERMLADGEKPSLGIEGYPPERSMYESVLAATGLHREREDGTLGFAEPEGRDDARLQPVWEEMRQSIFGAQGEPVALNKLFATLAAAPYGVPDGLHPVLLCAFLLTYSDETTLYREGTFLPEPGIADFEVLMRRPELFAIAGSRVSGGRAAVVQRLAKGLKVNPATVPVVRSLFRMVKCLPEFAWNTRRLPETTLKLRDTFQNAKSPERFLFVAIPEALGMPVFSETEPKRNEVDAFFDALNENLRGLSEATSAAIKTAQNALLQACGFHEGDEHWSELRTAALALEPAVTEPHLLTFLKRVTQGGADAAGVESVLALVANRPPRNWSDMDVDRFAEAAAATGRAFRVAARSTGVTTDSKALLTSLTQNERRQAEDVLGRVRQYLHRNVNDTSPRAIRAAVTRLLEELSDE